MLNAFYTLVSDLLIVLQVIRTHQTYNCLPGILSINNLGSQCFGLRYLDTKAKALASVHKTKLSNSYKTFNIYIVYVCVYVRQILKMSNKSYTLLISLNCT